MNRRSILILLSMAIIAVVLFILMRKPKESATASGPAPGGAATSAGEGAPPSGAAHKAGAAPAHPPDPSIIMSLQSQAHGAALYRFDASGSRDGQGNPLVRFRFDFGDGVFQDSRDGLAEHPYEYEYTKDVPLLVFPVVVTGWDHNGRYSSITSRIELDNAVGQERRNGRLLVEADPCTMSHSPESQSWFCTTKVRNPHAEPITFVAAAVAYEVRITDPKSELAVTLEQPGGLKRAGLVQVHDPQTIFPATITAGQVAEITFEVPDKVLKGGELRAVNVNGTGKGATSGLPARVTVRAALGPKRTWLGESEIKRAGLPPPPSSLDMPGPRLPPGADPSLPPPTE